ncbi:Zn-dependent exopeptidase [Dendrothele bispora CBS 962.96]|uniref:Peptide hydrolase n=1 Tax=Dendrothele bispora (strain CBS 962.96) TaxID=1314807 RepID=A0A4S8L6W6_DENBC|nr:Zn-dependent exopeptidase [Dendrothele bispora CBS 962.96]
MFWPKACTWTRLTFVLVTLSAFQLTNASDSHAYDGQVILADSTPAGTETATTTIGNEAEEQFDTLITYWPVESQAIYERAFGPDSEWMFKDSDLRTHGLNAIRTVQFESAYDEEGAQETPQVQWMTEGEKLKLKAEGTSLLDVTENFLHPSSSLFPHTPSNTPTALTYPSTPHSRPLVLSIFPHISSAEQKSFMTTFTDPSLFYTRYYNSEWGRNSSIWLSKRIAGYVEELGGCAGEEKMKIEVVRWGHRWLQDSVVVRLTPFNTSSTDPITVIGAHCDSINHEDPLFAAPGADDDGSGTVTILESLRALLSAKYVPKSPLEFHFYAAEEGGLLGSLAIVAEYVKQGKVIKGMQQFDGVGWLNPTVPPRIGVILDHVDTALTDFQCMLIDEYLDIPYIKNHYPGRASSDHESWSRAGYKACHVMESAFKDVNQNMHTPNDTIYLRDYSFEHLERFTKLAIAFAVEMTS